MQALARSPWWRLGLGASVALAAFLFLWQLGSPSFFIDEAGTMRVVDEPFADLISKVRLDENNPAGYFALLKLWTDLAASDAEWVARLPSALAAIALVVAVWRLGVLVEGQVTGLLAALLAALSPLVLQYAQQARPYALAMLAVTVAAIAALELDRRRSRAWLVVGTGASAVALSLHYMTFVVLGPLSLWALSRRALDWRARVGFCAVPAAVWLAWLPLAIPQQTDDRNAQVGEYGTLTLGHLVRVVAAPFDDRYSATVGVLKPIAAAAVAAALVAVVVRSRRSRRPELALMVAIPALQIVVLVAAAGVGIEVLNSRYMTFAVPFVLVAVATAVSAARAAVAVPGLAVLLVAAVVADAGSHRRSGFYADTRGVVDTIAASWRPGDVVLDEGTLGVSFPLRWYAEKRLPDGAAVLRAGDPAAQRLAATRPRVWIVRLEPPAPGTASAPAGYRALRRERFVGSANLTLELAVAPAR